MKKIAVSAGMAMFLFVAVGVAAESNGIDYSKPIKADDLKIEKKVVLPKEERLLLEKSLKGKPGSSSGGTQTAAGATGTLGAPLQAGARKFAILVGLSNYAGMANDLCVASEKTTETYPNNLCKDADALNMENTLISKYGYTLSDITRFSDGAANFAAIKAEVDRVTALVNDDKAKGIEDEVVFFFSGHSATSNKNLFKNGDRLNVGLALYNLPVDSSQVIWDGQLAQWFSNLKTSRIVFIFDTCHAGGLGSYLQATGREVVMSSAENQYSYTYTLGGENGALGEGMFAHFFSVQGMQNSLADKYNAAGTSDFNVSVEEAWSYAKQVVPQMTANHQVPALNDKFSNDLLLGAYAL